MTSSVAAFAHLAGSASREREGFEATQVIESGGLRVEAFIRRTDRRSIHVEYKTYQSPWAELQEALSGQVEFVGDELCGLALNCEGALSWVVDPSTNTVLRKLGCQLYEPIPGLATLGELAFLDTLTQDFLLRDLGEETFDNRAVRRVGLKPKQTYRSQLLSVIAFPIRKATIDFDTETYFPLSISFVPSADSSAASILGPDATIRISYKDVRILDAAAANPSFSPPPDAKVFEEMTIAGGELIERLPFPVSTVLLREHGFDPAGGTVLVSRDAEHERSYATIQYTSLGSPSENAVSSRLTLTVGNYVSKTMARRRTTFSESGQPASDDSLPITLLDRKGLWEQRFPGIDSQFAPVEAFFEKQGVFWFVSGTGMDLDSMEALAKDLLEATPQKP